jgi:hypothetical protein
MLSPPLSDIKSKLPFESLNQQIDLQNLYLMPTDHAIEIDRFMRVLRFLGILKFSVADITELARKTRCFKRYTFAIARDYSRDYSTSSQSYTARGEADG